MLEFHYDFIDRFLDRADYQKLYMDTDSSYISVASENLEHLIKPDMRKVFHDAVYGNCHDRGYLPGAVAKNMRPLMDELLDCSNWNSQEMLQQGCA